MSAPLEQLALTLVQAGIELQYVPKGYQDTPFEQVLVALDEDPSKDELEYVLQLYRPVELMDVDAQYNELQREVEDFDVLILHLPLPSLLNRKRFLDTYQLMAFFNQLLPIGYFDLNPYEDEMYYHHSLISEVSQPNPVVVADAVEKLSFFLPLLGSKLIALHETNKTVSELVGEVGLYFDRLRSQTV